MADGTSFSDSTLAFFMTFGNSLEGWSESEILSREMALYKEHAEKFDTVYIFTYSKNDSGQYSQHFSDNIEIIDQKVIGNDLLYSVLFVFIHWRTLNSVDIVKTNQMMGSWAAVVASVIFRIPLVVRTGYVLSYFGYEKNLTTWKRFVIFVMEFVAYRSAEAIITSSPHGKSHIDNRYNPKGIHVMIPNYIETDVFKQLGTTIEEEKSLCYVGRLVEQKNVGLLLDALADIPYSLTVIGDGHLRHELKEQAKRQGVEVDFKGRIPNQELPQTLNEHTAFVLPSLYEGMPKSLLEAMSCGMPVIGTRVSGIRDVIEHRQNGLLCDTDVTSMQSAIAEIMQDEGLREELGDNARQTIVDEYCFENIVEKEQSLMEAVLH